MSSYAQFDKDGQVITQVNSKEDLPQTWIWEDGSSTSNFHLLEDEELAEAGWFPVNKEERPKFNEETHHLVNERVVLMEGEATRTWDVEKIPPVVEKEHQTQEPSLEERVSVLEEEIKKLKKTT